MSNRPSGDQDKAKERQQQDTQAKERQQQPAQPAKTVKNEKNGTITQVGE